jgi:8-oxo-dGTP pyrophosphatase MutT (NUDIX family)
MQHINEQWQGYDEQGRPTRPITLAEAAQGALHGAAHVWVWRCGDAGVEVLLQQRQPDRRTWPGYWDIAAAGHSDAGEDPPTTALRETREEIGLALAASDLRLLFMQRADLDYAPNAIREHEIQWAYAAELPPGAPLTLQKEEIAAICWVALEALPEAAKNGVAAGPHTPASPLVPHGTAYCTAVQEGIVRLST